MDNNKLNKALFIINELLNSKYKIDMNDCYKSIMNDKYFIDFTNINRELNEQISITSLINNDYFIISQDEANYKPLLYLSTSDLEVQPNNERYAICVLPLSINHLF